MPALFGGAMSCALPDDGFVDVSRLREVPDNQEVFARVQGDDSVIIELVDPLPDAPTADLALRRHFEHLAEDNRAFEATVDDGPRQLTAADVPLLSAAPQAQAMDAWMLCGRQAVAKFREGAAAANTVQVWLGLVRLPAVATDVLVSFNRPLAIAPTSSSAAPTTQLLTDNDAYALFAAVLRSLAVHDWGLFSG